MWFLLLYKGRQRRRSGAIEWRGATEFGYARFINLMMQITA